MVVRGRACASGCAQDFNRSLSGGTHHGRSAYERGTANVLLSCVPDHTGRFPWNPLKRVNIQHGMSNVQGSGTCLIGCQPQMDADAAAESLRLAFAYGAVKARICGPLPLRQVALRWSPLGKCICQAQTTLDLDDGLDLRTREPLQFEC